ncbi:MAG: glucan biosynthesis protein, partial [Thiomonas sp.]
RKKIAQLGLAPISSMFFFGENQHAVGDDYRPEVHDSDGLSIASRDGEWLWRPLVNPKRLLATSFAQVDPVGFGLMQRDRHFSNYEDLGARFDLRPSVWIEPVGNWGAGRVELVELPDPDETNHNITAFWVPDVVPVPGKGYPFAYRIWWQKDSSHHPPLAWVTQSRSGNGYMPNPDHSQAWVVDFDGPVLQELTADSAITGAVSTGGNAKLLATWVQHNDVTGGWRLTVRLKRVDDSKPVELRAFLRLGKQQVTETWSYIIPPK